jgi:hypothetical protein
VQYCSFKHYRYSVLYVFLRYFSVVLRCVLHIPMCHMLVVSDPHHMALCKKLLTVIVLVLLLCSGTKGALG